jgi:hypothetical protein
MALQLFVGPWPLFSFLIYTQSVGLLGLGISLSQGRYLHTEQHRHRIIAHRHPCLEWDRIPQHQCSRGSRKETMPQTALPLWSAPQFYYYILLFIIVGILLFMRELTNKFTNRNTCQVANCFLSFHNSSEADRITQPQSYSSQSQWPRGLCVKHEHWGSWVLIPLEA